MKKESEMRINRNNYEVFFIDYFDGNLDAQAKNDLQDFLLQNPDLKEEFDTFEIHKVVEPQDGYLFKDQLKKQTGDLGAVNENNIDEYSIAYLEGDLNGHEKEILLDAIKKNTVFEQTFNLYQQIKFEPDHGQVFGFKRQTKHFALNSKTIVRAIGIASAAAVLILGVFVLDPANDAPQDQGPVATTLQPIAPLQVEPLETKSPDPSILKESKTSEMHKTVISSTRGLQATNQEIENTQPDEAAPAMEQKGYGFEKIASKTLRSIGEARPDVSMVGITNPPLWASSSAQPLPEQKSTTVNKVNRDFNLWDVAELGIKVFNRLNETHYDIETHYSDNGKIQSISLITEDRKITTPAI
jgi:hypothetical protein